MSLIHKGKQQGGRLMRVRKYNLLKCWNLKAQRRHKKTRLGLAATVEHRNTHFKLGTLPQAAFNTEY